MISGTRDYESIPRFRVAIEGSAVARVLSVLAVVATAACEIGLTTALVRGSAGPVPVLAGHVLLCLVIAGIAVRIAHRPAEAALLAHLTLWTCVAGPLGSLLAIGLITLDREATGPMADRTSGVWQNFSTWMEAQGGLERPGSGNRIFSDLRDRRLRVSNVTAVRALGDVIAKGDKAAKFEALANIGRRFDPSLSHVIRAAIKDDDPSVRVLASTVLAKLQTRFTRELIALQNAAAEKPTDAVAWMAVARGHRAYAESGLIEAMQAQTEVIEAAVAARKAVSAAPQNREARDLLAELERVGVIRSEERTQTDSIS